MGVDTSVAYAVHKSGSVPQMLSRNASLPFPFGKLLGQDSSVLAPQSLTPLAFGQQRWRFVMKFRTALLATIVTALVAGSVHAQTLRVTIRKAPIRSGPGSQESLVATAMEDDLLEYVDVEGLWYIVRLPSTQQVGYVHSALVEQTSRQAPANTPRPPARTTASPPPPPPPRMSEPSAPPPPPPSPSRSRDPEPLPNTQPSLDRVGDDVPWEHRGLGIGFRTGHSTIAMAFNLRTWGHSKGLSFDITSELDVLQLQPSLMFKIGQPIDFEALYLQPYVGIGANALWNRSLDDFGVGVVALGGADFGFTALPNLTVSLDLGYISDTIDSGCGADCFTSNFSDRLGLNFGLNWYFK